MLGNNPPSIICFGELHPSRTLYTFLTMCNKNHRVPLEFRTLCRFSSKFSLLCNYYQKGISLSSTLVSWPNEDAGGLVDGRSSLSFGLLSINSTRFANISVL